MARRRSRRADGSPAKLIHATGPSITLSCPVGNSARSQHTFGSALADGIVGRRPTARRHLGSA
eukprot:746653-Pyramimonas_sp.AAC.1